MQISIFGLGYVGAVCAACWAREGHKVIGVDPNPTKLALINAGHTPIVETGLGEMISESVNAGRLKAIGDPVEAVLNSELSLVSVGTPSKGNGSLDLSHIASVCAQIGDALRQKDGYHVVVIRSTVLPGTINDVVIPTLEKHSGKRLGEGFSVACNPEFLRESTAIHDFYNPPKTIIGQSDARGGDLLASLYEKLNAPLFRVDLKTAEMMKYADNAWHATKVVFANEIGNICKEVGIDGHELMGIFCRDTILNLSPYYMRPGFAFGGSCLPKDVRAICYKAKDLDVKTPLLESLIPSNEQQLQRAMRMIQQQDSNRIGMLGLSFKAGTDDLRESPPVELTERLLGKGYDIKIYDKNVSTAALNGANRDFIMTKIPHIARLMTDDMNEVIRHGQVLVIGNGGEEFHDLPERLGGERMLIDLVRVTKQTSNGSYQGICW
jgi:GDP-mannose 6-dehydrogenase